MACCGDTTISGKQIKFAGGELLLIDGANTLHNFCLCDYNKSFSTSYIFDLVIPSLTEKSLINCLGDEFTFVIIKIAYEGTDSFILYSDNNYLKSPISNQLSELNSTEILIESLRPKTIINITDNLLNGNYFIINGIKFIAGVDFLIGVDITETLENIKVFVDSHIILNLLLDINVTNDILHIVSKTAYEEDTLINIKYYINNNIVIDNNLVVDYDSYFENDYVEGVTPNSTLPIKTFWQTMGKMMVKDYSITNPLKKLNVFNTNEHDVKVQIILAK